ncbi:MAG TPA: OmpA family protein, partial [Kofleriaceae bacterium]|nr:OmpA family protein [Kofleriaceae bacterium]
LLIGGLAIARGRRRSRALAAALFGLVAVPAAVRAQGTETRNFSVERFQLAADRNGLFNVEWAEHPGSGALDAAFVVGLVDDPLVVYRTDQTTDRMIVGSLVATRATADLIGSIAVHRLLSIGLDLPLVIYQDRPTDNQLSTTGLDSLSSFGLGNLRVAPKLTLLTQARHGVGLAVLATLVLPTESSDDAYLGDHGVSVAPAVALSRRFGLVRTGVNLGYLARKQSRLLDLVVDDELFARAGIGYDLPVRSRPVSLDVTMSAATAASDFDGHLNINHLEGLVGATCQVDREVQLFGGAGAGLAHGFGTPDARVMVGVRLTHGGGAEPRKPVELDRDRDGIVDALDRCPTEPEDRDGFEDDDGCPDPDNDKDGVLDAADACPMQPGITELKGCPAVDTDGDGIPDHQDACPTQAEDKDGFEDGDGCPDPDNDKDGIPDAADACPMQPGPEATKGCPDPDRDGDGVVDRLDNCPGEPGAADNAGCPRQQLVKLGGGKLDMIRSVYFKLDKAIIEQRSFTLLDNVAAVLASHPTLTVQVEGHTDSQGDDAYNLELSQRRAEAVVEYLVSKGVDRARLQAKGFGETQPIADNKTQTGRAQNRRVVFTIIGDTTIENQQQGADDSTREH